MMSKAESLDQFLPYELPYLTKELENKAKVELSENDDTRTRSLEKLRTMLNGESFHFMDEDIFLLAFLRARKFDVQKAFKAIKSLHASVHKEEYLYSNFEYSDIERTLAQNFIGFLPFRDKEGCSILYVKYENWNPPEYTLADAYRTTFAGIFHTLLSPSTQVAGIKIIIDFKGLTLSKLTYISPRYLHIFAHSIQNCIPVRISGFYIVNENIFVPGLWFILKRFLSIKLRDRFHFFGKDFSKLQQHIPSEILPKEYGGNFILNDNSKWASKVAEKSDYLMNILCATKTRN